MLYRVFPFVPEAAVTDPGGALYAPRYLQGAGRHDSPDRYAALYLSRVPEGTVAERLRRFGGRRLDDHVLVSASGARYAMATVDESSLELVVDLDEPRELTRRSLRPSTVATRDRELTQAYAAAVFDEGAQGLWWWSAVEASWINVTLFAERVDGALRLAGPPEPLSLGHPAVLAAADALGLELAA